MDLPVNKLGLSQNFKHTSGIIPILKFLLKKLVYSVQNVMYMYETNKHLMHHKIVKYII